MVVCRAFFSSWAPYILVVTLLAAGCGVGTTSVDLLAGGGDAATTSTDHDAPGDGQGGDAASAGDPSGGGDSLGGDPNGGGDTAGAGDPSSAGDPSDGDSNPGDDETNTALFTLTIIRSGSSLGQVTSSPAGLTCGTTCSAEFPEGTAVTLDLESPSVEHGALSASGGCVLDRRTVTVTLDADTTCTLTFGPLLRGDLMAVPSASREVARMPANDAPASDSQSQLFADAEPNVDAWRWKVYPADGDSFAARYAAPVFQSTDEDPVFTCPNVRRTYDVELTVSDGATFSTFRSRRLISCTLPRTPAGRPVIDVDGTVTNDLPVCGADVGTPSTGTLVRVSGSFSRNLNFYNLTGLPNAPVHVINSGGAVVNTDTSRLLHCYNCQHVIFDGFGVDGVDYGFSLSNTTDTFSQAVFFKTAGGTCRSVSQPLRGLRDIEVFGFHVGQNGETDTTNGFVTDGGTGIEINTRGDTDGTTIYSRDTGYELTSGEAGRPGLQLHHNLIERTGSEGFYVGFTVDWESASYDDTVTPYQIRGAKVYRNIVRDTGKDGIQMCNSREMEVHDNDVDGVGRENNPDHLSSFQMNSGSEGSVFANTLRGGVGSNMQLGCTGDDLFFFANVMERSLPGDHTVYLKGGLTNGVHLHFFHNTVLTDGEHLVGYNMDSPGCGGSAADVDGLYVANNVLIIPDAKAVARKDSGGPNIGVIVATPNIRRQSATATDLCLADPANLDVSVCDTSVALQKSGIDLTTVGFIDPAALPLGGFTDRRGRLSTDSRGSGAFGAAP